MKPVRTRLALAAACLLLLATAAVAAAPPRGYQPRACGFDLDDDGVIGEPLDDCRICDGATADPDGDGVAEDLIYVDCQSGADTGSCGAPNDPCRSITHAWTVRADGPGDGAEDVICFRGVCAESGIVPAHGGVGGVRVSPASGSQARNWRYPADPTMLVGWDADGDGIYPPEDGDDQAVLSGWGLDRAFYIDRQSDFLEMAHFRVAGYGTNTGALQTGFLRFGPRSGTLVHLHFHDLELHAINRARTTPPSQASSVIVFNLFSGNTRPRWVSFENLLVTENGAWFARGEAVPQSGPLAEIGPYRFQHVTRTARGCNFSQCGDAAATTGFRLWGYMTGIEVIDSVWDANVAAWEPKPEGGPIGARLMSIAQCSRDWDVRNNEIIDHKVAIDVQGFSDGFCDDGDARPVEDVWIDANVIRNDYAPWRFGDVAVQLIAGGDSAGEWIGDVRITNNLCPTSTGWEAAIWMRHGHQNQPVDGEIAIVNNTFRSDVNRHGAIVLGDVEGSDFPRLPRNVRLDNNLILGLDAADRAILTTYQPPGFTAATNVYGIDATWEWGGIFVGTLGGWQGLTGTDAGSRVCSPTLLDVVHLSGLDACARDQGSDRIDYLGTDLDFEPRNVGGAWDVGADEAPFVVWTADFEDGQLPPP